MWFYCQIIIFFFQHFLPRYAVRLLREAGAFAYTRGVLRDLDTGMREEVARLGGNEKLLALLDELKDWE